jgi:uncharacterized protein
MKDGLPDKNELSKRSVSRRKVLLAGAAASMSSFLSGQMPSSGTPPAGAPVAGHVTRPTQGGSGPIKVLFITKYHPFDREGLFSTLDEAMGKDITWTHVEHPAAEEFFDPKLAAQFDVFLFFDAFPGRTQKKNPDGTTTTEFAPPPQTVKDNFRQLLQNGNKGFVFFHHAIAAWVHSWPEYVEVMGAAADWGAPLKGIRGKDYPISGFKQNTRQHITIVDRSHPVTEGVSDFDIVDEVYLCPMFEDSVHCLMRTDFKPVAEAFGERQVGHPPGSNMTGWVKTAERSPVVYIQHGHDKVVWENPAWQKLMLNSIKWAASKDAKEWANSNPKKIFA